LQEKDPIRQVPGFRIRLPRSWGLQVEVVTVTLLCCQAGQVASEEKESRTPKGTNTKTRNLIHQVKLKQASANTAALPANGEACRCRRPVCTTPF